MNVERIKRGKCAPEAKGVDKRIHVVTALKSLTRTTKEVAWRLKDDATVPRRGQEKPGLELGGGGNGGNVWSGTEISKGHMTASYSVQGFYIHPIMYHCSRYRLILHLTIHLLALSKHG